MAADAILRFERSTGAKTLKRVQIEQPVAFKRRLDADKNVSIRKPLSKATIDCTLRTAKAFFIWLAGQPGYKSCISYADAEYFNVNAEDARVTHAHRDVPFHPVQLCHHAFAMMPEANEIERRNKALIAFLKIASRFTRFEAGVERYISDMMRVDRHEEGEARTWKVAYLVAPWQVCREYEWSFVS